MNRPHLLVALATGLLACNGEEPAQDSGSTTPDFPELAHVMRDCEAAPGRICPWAGDGYNGFNGDARNQGACSCDDSDSASGNDPKSHHSHHGHSKDRTDRDSPGLLGSNQRALVKSAPPDANAPRNHDDERNPQHLHDLGRLV